MYDLLILNGDVVTPQGPRKLAVAIRDGRIAELGTDLATEAMHTINASGKLVFPGFFDSHTHMGIPIMDTHSIDDFESGTVAAACGGITTIVDFTVQEPGQTLAESIDVRLSKAAGKSHVDYALHVNVTDDPKRNVTEIPELIRRGFRFYKVFSTYKQAGMMIGWPDFERVLRTVHENGGLLFLHAEDDDLVEGNTARYVAQNLLDPIYHPRSRTAEAEARAIDQAASIAHDLGARLYIVHLSSKPGLETALEWRAKGANLTLETCPQYLVLDESRYEAENGHSWITTPPLRTKEDSEALWQALAGGEIDVVATDHCPFTIAQKNAGNRKFHKTPNGIPGVETLFPLLYSYGVRDDRITLERLVELLAGTPAEIFGLSGKKGEISIGADADLVIWDPADKRTIRAPDLHGNADWSPYEGMTVQGSLEYTILRGQILVEKGKFCGDSVYGELQLA